MSKDTDDFVENILSARQWLRILLMVGFGILSWLLRFGQVAIALIQILFALITGRDNNNMRKAGTMLSLYQAHIWLYMSYSTDIKPYPFTDLPESGDDLDREMKRPPDDDTDEAGNDTDENDERSPDPASTQSSNRTTAGTATAGASSSADDVFSDISFTSGSTAPRKNQGDNAPSQDADDSSDSGKQDDSNPDNNRPA